ncbi:MAG: phage tail tube protein [Acidimicrobiales bacterium]
MGLGYVRIAGESIQGTEANSPTLATKKVFFPILEFTHALAHRPISRDDELVNTNDPRPDLEGDYMPTWGLRARMYPDMVAHLFSIAFGAPTTTAGDAIITDLDAVAVPVGATRHTWTSPFGPAGAEPKTAQIDVAYTTESAFYKLKGAAIDTISIETPEAGGVIVSVSGPANYLDKQTDPSLTPAYESETLHPFLFAHAGISWASGTADTRNVSVSQAMPIVRDAIFGVGSQWQTKCFKGNEPPMTTGSMEKVLIDQDDFDKMRDSTGFAAKVKWVSTDIIASAYPYKVIGQFENAQYSGGGAAPLTNAQRRGATFQWKATRTSAGAAVWQVINNVASYS